MSDPTGPDDRRVRSLLRRIAIDVSPLRQSRELRLLLSAQFVSSLGSAIAFVAVPFQVYEMTKSPLAVGMIGAAELVPLFVCSILGGAIADANDRRKLSAVVLVLQLVSALVLAVHTAGGAELWVLYVMAGVQAGLFGIAIPTRRSWTPRLVEPDQLPALAALESAAMTTTHLLGPALGGVAISILGVPGTFLLDAATFLVVLVAVWSMNPSPPSEHAPAAGFKSIMEGVRFLKGKRVLQGGLIIDLNAMIFGMPVALFPAVADAFDKGPAFLGLLYAAPWAGALVASATSGWTGRVRRQGRAVTFAVVGWGLAITAFGFADSIVVALVALAIAGGADAISAIFRTAIVQEVTPDHLRGRLSGIEIAVYAGGPTLGDVEAGVVAGLTTVPVSIVSGGLACVAGAGAVALALPQFFRYDRDRLRAERAAQA